MITDTLVIGFHSDNENSYWYVYTLCSEFKYVINYEMENSSSSYNNAEENPRKLFKQKTIAQLEETRH